MSIRSTIASAAIAAMLPGAALAAPMFETFGDLSDAGPNAPVTFGGSGIPDDNTAIADIELGVVTGLIGLTITPRFANPAPVVGPDGVFTVLAGTNDGTPGNPGNRATWNFSFYADILPGVDYELLYDFDPSNDNDYGILQIDSGFFTEDGAYQNSQNATFGYLQNDNFGVNTAPANFDFDPDLDGIYNFRLIARDVTGAILGEVAVDVIVGDGPTDVPAPAALGLLGLGVLGLGAARRRRG